MRQISRHLPFSKILWLLMAFHILCIESEFPEALEDKPTVGYSLSAKKIPSSSFLKKILKASTDAPEKIQEDDMEMPDYAPLGLKCKTVITFPNVIISQEIIPSKEQKRPQYKPELHYRPPQFRFS